MPWHSISIDEAITYLNVLVALDPKAIHSLVETRHPCNKALADHPTAQVAASPNGGTTIGLLGILNGMFGVDDAGWGPITANFDKDMLVNFSKSAPR